MCSEDETQQIPTSWRDPGDGNAAGNHLGMSFLRPSAASGRMELGKAAQQSLCSTPAVAKEGPDPIPVSISPNWMMQRPLQAIPHGEQRDRDSVRAL